MHYISFTFNPYRECTYVLYKERASACIIIDCGAYQSSEQQQLATYLREHQLTPVAHLVTHAHPDHICGAEWLAETYGVTPIIHPAEGVLELPGNDLSNPIVLRTPGHKEDAVCYYWPEQQLIITGDTLFEESVGRTDLPGGDTATLIRSLQQLMTLPDNTIVLPGHGPTTSIGHERKYNPYI